MKSLSVKKFVSEAKKGNISIEENTAKVLEEINSSTESHYFNAVAENALERAKELKKKKKGKLFGVPVSVKDCICVKGLESTAGSKILKGYKPVFNATVIEKIEREGAIVIGKTSQDEFGFGSFNTNTGIDFQIPVNPFDSERVCGGSSGGSAAYTAFTKYSHVSIAESTGGSIACPSSFCGVSGFTPTYGKVSRYGLIDYASSLDKIGSIGKTTEDSALLLEIISGKDSKDSTSFPSKTVFPKKNSVKGLKIAVVKELFGEGIDSKVKEIVMDAVNELEKEGAKVKELSLPISSEYSVPSYYLIAMAESSTNLAKFCGMRYGFEMELEGNFDDYFSKIRSTAFGEEAKRRIILGTFARMSGFREAYYLKALKARTKIIEEFKKKFKEFDVIANPSMPFPAPKLSETKKMTPLQNYLSDICTMPSNLCGFPHISINAGYSNGLPVGIMFSSDHFQEQKIVQAGIALEEVKS